jgi:hypothetical protein
LMEPTFFSPSEMDGIVLQDLRIAPQQQFLIDRSGDVGHHPRPKHFGFPAGSTPQ